MLEELEEIKLENKEKVVGYFKELINKVQNNEEYCNYGGAIIIKETVKGEKVITIVPDEFLGFSVKINDLRVSCFGVSCDKLGRVVIEK